MQGILGIPEFTRSPKLRGVYAILLSSQKLRNSRGSYGHFLLDVSELNGANTKSDDKKWVNVIAMISIHARVVYRPSLKLYLYVTDDPVTAVIIGYSNFIYIIY